MSFQVNRPPCNGSLVASPLSGVSLLTNFTLRARWWADAEGDLPLAYTYTAGKSHHIWCMYMVDVLLVRRVAWAASHLWIAQVGQLACQQPRRPRVAHDPASLP